MSKTTLRRRLQANQIEGAARAEDGSWSIPISSLVQAGLLRATTPPDEPASTTETTESSTANQAKPDLGEDEDDDSGNDPGNLLINIAKPGPRTPPAVLAVELSTLRHRAELAEHERNAAKSELIRADQTIQDLRRNVDLLERMLPPASDPSTAEPDDSPVVPDRKTAALESTIEKLRGELDAQQRAAIHTRALANAGWRERRRLRRAEKELGP